MKYVALFLLLFSSSLWSQQCSSGMPPASDFELTDFLTLSNHASFSDGRYVHGIDFAKDGSVFFIVKKGHLGLIKKGTVELLLKLNVNTSLEQLGLRGIALDPKFDENGWIYLNYTAPNKINGKYESKVVRLLYANGKIIQGAERVILSWLKDGVDHVSGQMSFGPNGYLHIISGDDVKANQYSQHAPLNWAPNGAAADASKSTANTNDFRGKTLRIKPIPFGNNLTPNQGLGTTYTVPDNNLFSGDNNPKTLPEIYTMGHRAGWNVSVDPIESWVFIGEGGPAASTGGWARNPERGPYGHEEYNIANKAGFFGWPYFNADNQPYRPWDFSSNQPLNNMDFFDANDSIRNGSPRNTGATMLPPPKPAAIYHSRRGLPITGGTSTSHSFFNNITGCVGLSGPRYYYGNYRGNESYSPASVKLPPFFDKKWFISDTDGSFLAVATLDYNKVQEKVSVTSITRVNLPGGLGSKRLSFELGRDGALYFAGEHGIKRLAYKGSCRPSDEGYKVEFKPEESENASIRTQQSTLLDGVWAGTALKTLTIPALKTEVVVYNTKGERVWSHTVAKNNQDQVLTPPTSLRNNLHIVKFY